MNTNREHLCDVLVIGSGAAGLSLALRVAERAKVIVLSKGPLSEGATYYAQGGIAAVFDEADSIESHVNDTNIAGAGLCEEDTVQFIAENAKECVQWLIDGGVPFDQVETEKDEAPRYHLTREGGHSHRRILHAADATGMAMQTTLQDNVQNHPNIEIFERYNALDLITEDKVGGSKDKVVGAIFGTATKSTLKRCALSLSCWQRAARQKCTSTPQTQMSLLATVLQWHGAQAAALPT